MVRRQCQGPSDSVIVSAGLIAILPFNRDRGWHTDLQATRWLCLVSAAMHPSKGFMARAGSRLQGVAAASPFYSYSRLGLVRSLVCFRDEPLRHALPLADAVWQGHLSSGSVKMEYLIDLKAWISEVHLFVQAWAVDLDPH